VNRGRRSEAESENNGRKGEIYKRLISPTFLKECLRPLTAHDGSKKKESIPRLGIVTGLQLSMEKNTRRQRQTVHHFLKTESRSTFTAQLNWCQKRNVERISSLL